MDDPDPVIESPPQVFQSTNESTPEATANEWIGCVGGAQTLQHLSSLDLVSIHNNHNGTSVRKKKPKTQLVSSRNCFHTILIHLSVFRLVVLRQEAVGWFVRPLVLRLCALNVLHVLVQTQDMEPSSTK